MLCDTEREREMVAGIRQRTHSLWDYLDSREDLVNTSFRDDGGILLMPLPTLLRNVTLWTDRHCMYGPTYRSRPPLTVAKEKQSPLQSTISDVKVPSEEAKNESGGENTTATSNGGGSS